MPHYLSRVFAVLFFTLGIFLLWRTVQTDDVVARAPVTTRANEAIEVPAASVDEQEENDGMVLVTRVVDGDTIEIEDGEKVRYIGVNTPESVDPRKVVQCFGKEASEYNKKLVEGKRVRLEPDVEDRDKYHRLLRYVWLGDTMVNEKLMQDGYAQVMTIAPNVKYVERFKSAQTAAREAKRGLWSACRH